MLLLKLDFSRKCTHGPWRRFRNLNKVGSSKDSVKSQKHKPIGKAVRDNYSLVRCSHLQLCVSNRPVWSECSYQSFKLWGVADTAFYTVTLLPCTQLNYIIQPPLQFDGHVTEFWPMACSLK